jgi:hypothetical protein
MEGDSDLEITATLGEDGQIVQVFSASTPLQDATQETGESLQHVIQDSVAGHSPSGNLHSLSRATTISEAEQYLNPDENPKNLPVLQNESVETRFSLVQYRFNFLDTLFVEFSGLNPFKSILLATSCNLTLSPVTLFHFIEDKKCPQCEYA